MPIVDPNTKTEDIILHDITTQKVQTTEERIEEEREYGFFGRFGYDVSLLWQTLPIDELKHHRERDALAAEHGIDTNFDWYSNAVPELRDDYASYLYSARNIQELKSMEDNLYENLNAKAEIAEYSLPYQFLLWGTSLAQDPLIFMNPAKNVRPGASMIKNAASMGARTTALVAPFELARIALDPTSNMDELKYTLTGSFLFGGALGPIVGKYKGFRERKRTVKEIDKIIDNAFDEIDYIASTPSRKIFTDASGARIRGKKMEEVPVDTDWRDSTLRIPDESKKVTQAARNVLKYPLGLERSWLDESFDIVKSLVKDGIITTRAGNELIDQVLELSGDSSYILNRTPEGQSPSVSSRYQSNYGGEIHNVRHFIQRAFRNINGLAESKALDAAGDFDAGIQTRRLSDFFKRKTGRGTRSLIEWHTLKELISLETAYPTKSVDEFINEYGARLNTTNPEEVTRIFKEVKKSAKDYSTIYNRFYKDLFDNGLIDNAKVLDDLITRLEKQLTVYEKRLKKFEAMPNSKGRTAAIKDTKEMIAKRKGELQLQRKSLNQKKGDYKSKGQKNYMPLIYDPDLIRPIRGWVEKEIAKTLDVGDDLKPRAIRAKEIVDNMLNEGAGHFDNTGGRGRGGTKYLMKRSLQLPRSVIKKIAILDAEVLFRNYYRKIAPRIELAKSSGVKGDVSLYKWIDRIDEITTDAMSRAKSAKDIENIRIRGIVLKQNIHDMRDALLGNLITDSQSKRFDAKLSRDLKNLAASSVAGGFALNSFADIGNILGRAGLGDTWAGLLRKYTKLGTVDGLDNNKEMLVRWGILNEMAMSSVGARFIGDDGLYPTHWANKLSGAFSKGLDKMGNEIHKYSGLGPLTVWLKSLAGNISQQSIIARARVVANNATKLKNGKYKINPADNVDYDILSSLGFDLKDIIKLGLNTDDVGYKNIKINGVEQKDLWEINTQVWKDQELANKFGHAVWAETQMTVMTPQMAQRPGWLMGVWRGFPHSKMWAKRIANKSKLYDEVSKDLKRAYESNDKLLIRKAEDKFDQLHKEMTLGPRHYAPLVSNMFQFFNFAVAAAQKITYQYTQGSHRHKFQGLTAVFALAYVSQWAKNPEYFESLTLDQQLYKATEYAGVTSWIHNANTYVEQISPLFIDDGLSARDAFGVEPLIDTDDVTGQALRSAGTPYHHVRTTYDVLFRNDEFSNREINNKIRSMIPFMNLPYTKPFAKKIQRWMED